MQYQVKKGSQTGHCCFQWSVVDTARQLTTGDGKPLTDDDGCALSECICECYQEADARLIADRLNAA